MDPVIQQRIAKLARRLPDAYFDGSPRHGEALFSDRREEIYPGRTRIVSRPIDSRSKLAMLYQSDRGLDLLVYASPENDISFWGRIIDDDGGYHSPEEWDLERIIRILDGNIQVTLAKKVPQPFVQDRDDLTAWVYSLLVDLGFDQQTAKNLVAGRISQYTLLAVWWVIDFLSERVQDGTNFDGLADTLVGILRTSRPLKPLDQIEFYDYNYDKLERALTSIGATLPPPVTRLGPNEPNAVPLGHLVEIMQLLEEENTRQVLRGLSHPETATEPAMATV